MRDTHNNLLALIVFLHYALQGKGHPLKAFNYLTKRTHSQYL